MRVNLRTSDIRELRTEHAEAVHAIRARLADFAAVPRERHFYELCYCLMTPQSSAVQCHAVAMELERLEFFTAPFDASQLLRSHNGGYVRFHNTKARRLNEAQQHFSVVRAILDSASPVKAMRNDLARTVQGLGMKEASHFLRNIGFHHVTIVDRHIIRNLLRLHALPEWPTSISKKRYLEIEEIFEAVAEQCRIDPDELDLLLWSRETGSILK